MPTIGTAANLPTPTITASQKTQIISPTISTPGAMTPSIATTSTVEGLQPLPIQNLQLLLLAANINQTQDNPITQCYLDPKGHLWVSENDLQTWRLRPPASHMPLQYNGQRYYLLDWYPGLHYVVNQQTLSLTVEAPPELFPTTAFAIENGVRLIPGIRPTKSGAFLNYSATVLNVNEDTQQLSESAFTEAGLFTPKGVATNQVLLQHTQINGPNAQAAVRLDTAWTLDQPEHMATWRLGDATTSALDWGGAVHFGGIQYGTNFATQPNLITFPTPSLQGTAAIPSTVDLLINGNRSFNQSVPSGRFVLNTIPLVSGNGTMELITQNILGQNQVVTVPYYVTPVLLKPGLTDYSYQLGFIRQNYGIDSFNYSNALGVGTYNRGITDHLSIGGQLELQVNQQTAGTTWNYLWQRYGVWTLGAAASQVQGLMGALGEASFTRQSQFANYGVREIVASRDFVQIGLAEGQRSPSLTSQVFAGLNTKKIGSLSATYTVLKGQTPFANYVPQDSIAYQSASDIYPANLSQIVTLTYSRGFLNQVSFLLGGSYDITGQHPSAFASIIWAFDGNKTIQLNGNYSDTQVGGTASISQNIPTGEGWGYQLAGGAGATPVLGSVTWNAPIATYSASYSHAYGQNNYEVDTNGSVVYFDKMTSFMRNNYSNSFALVEVPGFPHVRVYYRNILMGRTDKTGKLFIPNLLPYQENEIGIEVEDLPFNAKFSAITKTVMPYLRSGIVVRFNVTRTLNAIVRVQTPDHQDLPPLTSVTVGTETFPVGYEGVLDLSNLTSHDIIGSAILADGHPCRFTAKIPDVKDNSIPDLGTAICENIPTPAHQAAPALHPNKTKPSIMPDDTGPPKPILENRAFANTTENTTVIAD